MDEFIQQAFNLGQQSANDPDKTRRSLEELNDRARRESNKKKPTDTANTALGVLGEIVDANLQKTTPPETTNILTSFLTDLNKPGNSMLDAFASTAFSTMKDYFAEQSFLLDLTNRKLGMTGELSRDFRDNVQEIQPDLVRLGISFKDIGDAVSRLVVDTGRFALVSDDTLRRAGEISAAYGLKMEEIIGAYSSFEKVGIGATNAQEALADAGKRSIELGLQSSRTMKDMTENIGKLNQYGFENGVEGLEKMVRRATEVRMSLQSVFNIADKVFDPEGALDLSANLQALGASFGEFNDPLRLMYMASNGVEGLQGALEGVLQNLARYDVESGTFEVTGIQLRQAREIAKQFGMTVEEVTQGAKALQERMSAATDLDRFDLTDQQIEFVTNLSRMKDGRMTLEITNQALQEELGFKSVAIEDLNEKTLGVILGYKDEIEKMSEGNLARTQVNLVEGINRDVNYLVTLARLRAAGAGDALVRAMVQADAKTTGGKLNELLKMNVDDLVKNLGDAGSAAITEVKKLLGVNNQQIEEAYKQEREEKEKQKSQQTQQTNDTNVNVKVTTDAYSGFFQKEWSNNPEKWLLENDKRSYNQKP